MDTIKDKLEAVSDLVSNRDSLRLDQYATKSRPGDANALPSLETVENLWQAMASMYGHKWVSGYGAQVDPDGSWAMALTGISSLQIEQGLKRCFEDCLSWPPSAPEFRKLCLMLYDKDDVGWEHARQRAANQERLSEQQPLLQLDNKTQKELWREKQKARMAQLRRETGI